MVEHVPQPVRWTIGKLVRLTLLVLLGLIVVVVVSVGLYVMNRTEWVAQEIALVVNQALARHTDVSLAIQDIRGNPLAGFEIVEPKVEFREGDLPPLLIAHRMHVRYSMWGLITGRSRSIDFEIDRPVVRLSRGADGRWRLPRWEAGGGSSANRPGELRLHLRLSNAQVVTPDSDLCVSGASLDAVAETSPARLDIAKLEWAAGPYRSRLDGFRAHAEFGDSVRIRVTELRSPDLELSGHAAWAAGGGPKRVVAEVTRVRWSMLARLFDNRTLDVPGEGRFAFEAKGNGAWQGNFTAAVDWDSLKGLGAGEFRWSGSQFMLPSFTFDSPAGKLEGRLTWSHLGWDLSGDVVNGNPERWSAIHITGWPRGDLNGWFRYTEDTRPRGSARLEALLGASELAMWRADSARVTVDFPQEEPDSFSVRMARRGGSMVLHGRTTSAGWNGGYQLSDYPLDEWADGKRSGLSGMLAFGSGTVESRLDGLYVTGDLAGRRASWLGLTALDWRLPDLSGRLLPTPDLAMSVRLQDALYLGVHFDSIGAGIRVGDQRVEMDSVRAAAGDTVVTLAGHSTFSERGWTVSLARAAAASNQFAWSAEPAVEFHGDSKDVWFDRLEAHDGDARVSISGQWAGAGGVYDWRARARGLDLGRLGLPPEWNLSGRSEAALTVEGDSGDPRWKFDAVAHSPGERGHAADSIVVSLSGSRSRLEVRQLGFTLHGGSMTGSARADGMARAWPDTLTADGVLHWVATAARWEGRLESRDLPLDGVGSLASGAAGVRGVLSGEASLRGRPASPEFDVDVRVRPAAWKEYAADEIALRATYADRRLEVAELRVTRSGLTSRAHGGMGLDLALDDREARVLETPMKWAIDAPNAELASVAQFVPQIGSAAGRFDLHATLEGTPRHPVIDGAALVRDGRVRLAAREEVLEALNARFRIQSSGITLDSLTARQGERGRVRASGRVDLDGFTLRDYRFDLTMRDFAAGEAGLYAALFDGDFVVTNGPRINDQTLPMVSGAARVKRAAILFDFSNQSETQQIAAATQPLFWTYRIQVDATDHLNWRPPEGDIEFNADLRMEQTRDSLLIYGEMHSLRGTYWFLSNKFNVQQADLNFDNVEGVNPQIDAIATTRVVAAPENLSEGPPASTDHVAHEITVHLKGRANKPVIDFDDDKNVWDQSRILREITYGRFVDPNNNKRLSAQDPVDNYLTRAINRSLSADLSQAFGGYINEWSLERDQGGLFRGEGEVIASARTQITSQFSMQYSQRIPGLARDITSPATATNNNLFEREVRAEYRLNRFFYITTDLAERRNLPGQVSTSGGATDYNVNLKARWEY
ncbi:MAG: translocation/assembly module TamB domain-containing protein [Candidatus Eisenbacteria bacterium]|nr:translocation/assembly module TamB domain-containing protein [Candidatus Eisenbacteria bacterium]